MLAVLLFLDVGLCVRLLLLNTHIQEGETALDTAKERNEPAVVALLEKQRRIWFHCTFGF